MHPPFDLSAVSLFSEPDRLVELRDHLKEPNATVRHGRYEGASLWLMRLEPQSGTFGLRWPATCAARTVDLKPGGPVDSLLELSPLPFAHCAMLAGMPGGVPTFYLSYTDEAYPDDDDAVRPSDTPVALTAAWFGILFQDRCALAPWAWFDRIAAAPGASAEWAAWAQAFAGRRTLRLIDWNGRPLKQEPVTILSGGQTLSASSDGSGDLGAVSGGSILSWHPLGSTGPLPAMNLLDSSITNVAGENNFELPAAFDGGHLQLLDLAKWFAPNLHDDPMSSDEGARFRRQCLMEPLVDGEAVFPKLLEELELAKGPGGAAYFTGWAFKDFPLRPGDENTRLVKLAEKLEEHATVKILAAQFVQASDQTLDSLAEEIGLIFMGLCWVLNGGAVGGRGTGVTGAAGLVLWALIEAAAIANYFLGVVNGERLGKLIKNGVEKTHPDFLDELAAVCRAVYSPHPVKIADNPIAADIILPDNRHIRNLQDGWGIFHQKIQLVQKKAETESDRYSAYIGGIDIHNNRLDSPGHQGATWQEPDSPDDPRADPFHDVHCRLTGAAVTEVFNIFKVRDELSPGYDPSRPVVVPTPTDCGTPGGDIIQVSQTFFKPAPGSMSQGFPQAEQGHATTHATFVQAIEAASEHIYIEEQYMVPSEPYMEALIAAAGHCQRLAILLPSYLEVYFADAKRGAFFNALTNAWGQRLFIGTPLRRPVLDPPGRVTSRGRLSLLSDIDQSSSTIVVGPAGRLPDGRFFLWIEGELMYAVASTSVTGPDGQPARELQVLRGGMGTQSRWCPDPRSHDRGAAVTAAQPMPIFLHSKIMMVDDVFVAIGSTNINRRGFFHDGEVTAFAIPEQLRDAPHNPARELRTRLWGEQLGLTPSLGRTLFRDPIAGFDLFKRSRYHGNRVVPLTELKVPEPTIDELPGPLEKLPERARDIIKLRVQTWIEARGQDIFNTLSDPTTGIENE